MTPALDEHRALAATIESTGKTPARETLAAVGASDWRVRGAAVRALRHSVSADDVGHLLATIERDHQRLDVLSSALHVLISANRDVVPPLIALLSDPHPNLRMHAALALYEATGRRDRLDQVSAESLAEVARVAAWLVCSSPLARAR